MAGSKSPVSSDKKEFETRHWMRPDLIRPSTHRDRNVRRLVFLVVVAGLAAAVVYLGDKPIALGAVVFLILLCCVGIWIPSMKRRNRSKPDPNPIRD